MQEKLKGNIKEQIAADLEQAQKFLEQAESNTVDDLQHCLPKIDDALRKLNDYRTLKQYRDSHENQRMFDLALFFKRKNAQQQYPQMISDYPKLVNQIGHLHSELDAVSQTVIELNKLKIKLQKALASLIVDKEKAHPLQSRFLDAFAIPLYRTFARHFWSLAWNSLDDPEMVKATQSLPEWSKANPKEPDYAIINALWNIYFSEKEFSQWILIALESMDENRRTSLELKLQTLEKNINETKASSSIEKEIKTQIQSSLLNDMIELCAIETKPSFSSMKELRDVL